MVANFVKTAALAVVVLSATTEAHNKMTLPLPTWADGFYSQNSPSGTIDPSDVLPVPSGMSYNTDPASNTNAYWTAFNASKYKSLKELAWDAQTLEGTASNDVTSAAQTEASEEEEEEPSTGDDASTDAEADETEAPATTTAPSVDKCSVRRRRH
ncbi:hypothetical protein AM588_10005453 [Phytophthora nicotianae]|uniref:Uncharacterized protein n=1 Tax=Phytophthora nicotianae TaxID=4792 RepID=A0A0W8D1I5_PHYNI|nr:hypothetical protein AM588_10005453 [Phytophthora nicotianae]